jgi:hypothetical protein
MIRFNKTVSVKQHRNGQWRINTDRGDEYLMSEVNNNYTPLGDWWGKQHQSELRGWQMDIFVKDLTRMGYGDDYRIWLVHKAGGGYNQPHDIAIMYHTGMKLWVLSTSEYHWLQPGEVTDTDFIKDTAFAADILERSGRDQLYPIIEALSRGHYKGEVTNESA